MNVDIRRRVDASDPRGRRNEQTAHAGTLDITPLGLVKNRAALALLLVPLIAAGWTMSACMNTRPGPVLIDDDDAFADDDDSGVDDDDSAVDDDDSAVDDDDSGADDDDIADDDDSASEADCTVTFSDVEGGGSVFSGQNETGTAFGTPDGDVTLPFSPEDGEMQYGFFLVTSPGGGAPTLAFASADGSCTVWLWQKTAMSEEDPQLTSPFLDDEELGTLFSTFVADDLGFADPLQWHFGFGRVNGDFPEASSMQVGVDLADMSPEMWNDFARAFFVGVESNSL